ncbi:hypothetical protein OIU77_026446 [Salix suchowensis]|uniref:Pentatricopeptide repeat-containing protein n=1 Tax=Salix suchowensis TaxID=1278906 RepID=A0ABQ9BLM6_9ROSI|nr:hypothetical protein OIU77_026446 [Salix suchowensis]
MLMKSCLKCKLEVVRPTLPPTECWLMGFAGLGDFEGGLKVLNAMLTSGHFPRVETFRSLVVGLLKSGNLDGACFVLEEMEKRQMTFCPDDWEALVMESCRGDENGSVGEHVNELVLTMEA